MELKLKLKHFIGHLEGSTKNFRTFYISHASLNVLFSPLSKLSPFLKHSRILSLRKSSPLTTNFLTNLLNLPIRLKASVSLLVPSSSLLAPERLEAPKLDRRRARKRLRTTKFPITTVARKKGTQTLLATHMQSHMDSIHSPQSTRNTIMKLCMKSIKFHRGIVFRGKRSTLSGIQRRN